MNNSAKVIASLVSLAYFLALMTIVFIVGYYFFLVYQNSVNIPYWDDYTHLKVITHIIDADSLVEKIKLLFSFHNEHRVVFARLITLASVLLTGEVNFFTLIILGNLSLVGIAIILFLSFFTDQCQDFRWRILYFLPAICLIFNLSYFEASLWALAALSSLPVILLSFLSIFILTRSSDPDSWWALVAFFVGVLAVFTQGNGLLVLYVGAFLLILQNRLTTGMYWGIGTAIISILYFYHYVSLDFSPHESGVLSTIDPILNYLVLFFGSWSSTPFTVGLFCLGLFSWLISSGLYRKNITFFGLLVFIFLSAAAVANGRYQLGMEQALSSRYKIYSLLFCAIIYLSIFEFLRKPWVIKCFFFLFFAAMLKININITAEVYDAIEARKLMLINGLVSWQQQGKGLTHWDNEVANDLIIEAIDHHIYYPPKFP
ncbi:hypothetical conserved protein [Candidatus Nitrosoglobus terrae]|uniref:Hypothetical conserved protein n=1 Tax=Candidatus Nitrosoglobus terrae TaxID=1630141 RepID=A0A1Q2SK73_9GAMM|nr:hypothetical protein [Candidatus Nitrosoglobus terrae]BAW79541.1 hypothetical conserved protein [Candidatus Nitrosoglobus terrae]